MSNYIKKQYNKASQVGLRKALWCSLAVISRMFSALLLVQFMSEKLGKDEGTKLDDQYKELERVTSSLMRFLCIVTNLTAACGSDMFLYHICYES